MGWAGAGGAAENPQDRIATEGHPQAGGHPGAGFPARFAPEDADGLGQPPGALRVRGGKRWQAFRKGPARTRGRETAETPDVHAEAYRVLRDGEVTQAARIAAMHACRRGVTIRAGSLGRTGTGVDEERGISCGDVFYHKAGRGKGSRGVDIQ